MDSFNVEIPDFERMRAIVSLGSWRVMLIGGGAGPFCQCGGVRVVFSGVAEGQALMRLTLQWRCR